MQMSVVLATVFAVEALTDLETGAYRHALPTDARLFHSTLSTKLLHVLAERTLAALRPSARFALLATNTTSPYEAAAIW